MINRLLSETNMASEAGRGNNSLVLKETVCNRIDDLVTQQHEALALEEKQMIQFYNREITSVYKWYSQLRIKRNKK